MYRPKLTWQVAEASPHPIHLEFCCSFQHPLNSVVLVAGCLCEADLLKHLNGLFIRRSIYHIAVNFV